MNRILYRERLESLQRARVRTSSTTFMPAVDGTDDFAAFSAHDFRRRVRLHPEVAWEDACRAYALAVATHTDQDRALDLQTEARLEDQWEQLSGDAGPDWPVARTMLCEAWRWLDEHGQEPGEHHDTRVPRLH